MKYHHCILALLMAALSPFVDAAECYKVKSLQVFSTNTTGAFIFRDENGPVSTLETVSYVYPLPSGYCKVTGRHSFLDRGFSTDGSIFYSADGIVESDGDLILSVRGTRSTATVYELGTSGRSNVLRSAVRSKTQGYSYSALGFGPHRRLEILSPKYFSYAHTLDWATYFSESSSFPTASEAVLRDFAGGIVACQTIQNRPFAEGGSIIPLKRGSIVAARRNDLGNLLWTRVQEGDAYQYQAEFALAPDGVYLIAQKSSGTSRFGAYEFPTESGICVLKISITGDLLWARFFPNASRPQFAVDPAGGGFLLYATEAAGVLHRFDADGETIAEFSDATAKSADWSDLTYSLDNTLTIGGKIASAAGLFCTNWLASTNEFLLATIEIPSLRAPRAANVYTEKLEWPAGSSIELLSSSLGSHPLRYKWIHNGAELPGETNALLVVRNATSASAGDYRVIVRNSAGSVTSNPVNISVSQPLRLLRSIASQTVDGLAPAAFEVVYISGRPVSIQWFHNDIRLSAETNAALSIERVTEREAGQYSVSLSDGATTIHAKATLDLRTPHSTAQIEERGSYAPSLNEGVFLTPDLGVSISDGRAFPQGFQHETTAFTRNGVTIWQKLWISVNECTRKIARSPQGTLLVGEEATADQSFSYPNLNSVTNVNRWIFAELSAQGEILKIRAHPILAGALNLDGDHIVVNGPNSELEANDELFILNREGELLARGRTRAGFKMSGRSFAADSSKIVSLSEFNASLEANATVFGRYRLDCKPDWVAQVPHTIGRWKSVTPLLSSFDHAVIALAESTNANNFEILSVIPGGLAWRIPIAASEDISLRACVTDLGAVIALGAATNAITIGDKTLPSTLGTGASSLFSFTIDAAGYVRTADRVTPGANGAPGRITRIGPSDFMAVVGSVPCRFKIEEPLPPPSMAASADAGRIHLSWPKYANEHYRLYSTTDLNAGFVSVSDTTTTNAAGSRIELSLPVSTKERYFRLAKP